MRYLHFFSFLAILFFISCNSKKDTPKTQSNQIENILDFTISPKSSFDKSGLMFSDQGAWFAYSFPDTITSYGGFSGPFLMTQQNGVWSSQSLAQLNLKNINWKSVETTSYNSHLELSFKSESIELKQEIVYLSGHTALIRSALTNKSNQELKVEYHWKNQPILAEGLKISSEENRVKITSSKTEAIGYLLFPKETIIKSSDSTYSTNSDSMIIKSNETKELLISQTFIFPEYSWKTENEKIKNLDFESLLNERVQEKEAQLAALIENRKPQFEENKYAEVLTKAHLTLQNNWRIPAGELKSEGLFPSYHYKWFNGFWAWDSWKHAVGLSYYDTTLAQNQIRAMFDFQNEDGFIVDCVFRDTLIEKHNYRDTKPPLSVWAIIKIYEKDGDLDFIKEMYPKLKKYHNWWYNKRDNDNDGLCEYGSTDGSLIAAKWESGMDNAIRFDNSKILKNEEGAYSLNQESVDLNSYLYAEKLYLLTMATVLQKNEDATTFKEEAETLKNKIQTQFYDPEDGWFYDTNLDGTTFIKGEGSEGWTALWANAASQEQAEAVKNQLMNPKKFFTKVPFQTMSADHEKFNPLKGYWRGPNWLD